MCNNCEICENLFSPNPEKRKWAENSAKSCVCYDSDCLFCQSVEIWERIRKGKD